jgi:hypothetical protein
MRLSFLSLFLCVAAASIFAQAPPESKTHGRISDAARLNPVQNKVWCAITLRPGRLLRMPLRATLRLA